MKFGLQARSMPKARAFKVVLYVGSICSLFRICSTLWGEEDLVVEDSEEEDSRGGWDMSPREREREREREHKH